MGTNGSQCRTLAEWETLSQRRDRDDGPNPFVLWNIMGGAFDGFLGNRALAMAGYVHPFQAGKVMVRVNERTYRQQLARAGTYRPISSKDDKSCEGSAAAMPRKIPALLFAPRRTTCRSPNPAQPLLRRPSQVQLADFP